MAIRMRSNGFQVDVQVDGQRHRRQVGSIDVARELEKAFQISQKNGKFPMIEGDVISFPLKKEYTLREGFEDTLARYWTGTANEIGVTYISNVVFKAFGSRTALKDIDNNCIEDFIVKQRAKFAPSTINKRLSFLSKIMRYAKKRGLITQMPDIDFLPVKSSRIRTFTDRERHTVMTFHADGPNRRWADFFTMLVDTGMRCGEVRNLDMRDVVDGTVQIWKNKADLPRSIPLTARALEALLRQAEGNDKPFAFATSDRIEIAWNEIRKSLRLMSDKEFVPHACRHDCLSRLLKSSGNLRGVQTWAGHRQVTQTQRYTHLHPVDLQNMRDAFEKL